jgi:putative hydrolase
LRILVDSHTHTISCGHAYSTVLENASVAARKGLEMIVVTDHGPAMDGASTHLHFSNLRVLPSKIEGVRVLKGIELNIIDYDGKVDLNEKYLKRLDFVLASLHDICIEPLNSVQNTNAIIGALKNPLIDAVAHPGNSVFPVDIEKVVLTAKEYGKFIEINNHSFVARKGSEENCKQFALLCKQYGVRVVCGSDSHYCESVGEFSNVVKLLEEVEMPPELIMNLSSQNFETYLIEKKNKNYGLV